MDRTLRGIAASPGIAVGTAHLLIWVVLVSAVIGAVIIVRMRGRIEGWRLALGVLAALTLFTVARK